LTLKSENGVPKVFVGSLRNFLRARCNAPAN
jgi:hypothetical protein